MVWIIQKLTEILAILATFGFFLEDELYRKWLKFQIFSQFLYNSFYTIIILIFTESDWILQNFSQFSE